MFLREFQRKQQKHIGGKKERRRNQDDEQDPSTPDQELYSGLAISRNAIRVYHLCKVGLSSNQIVTLSSFSKYYQENM